MSETTKAEVFRAADGFRFRLVNKRNGKIVAQSEGYENEADAEQEAGQIVGEADVELLPD